MGTIATTVFAQSLSNFTCKLWMMRGGTLFILGHGVKGQGQLCPPARGCHALRCLVIYVTLKSFLQGHHLWFIHENLFLQFPTSSLIIVAVFVKVGHIKLVRLSIRPSVCLKNFNLAHIFWSINDRALIFSMHDPYDKSFLLVLCSDLDV